MNWALAMLHLAAAPSPTDYLAPWHNISKMFFTGADTTAHVAWLVALAYKVLWLVFAIPTLIAFIDALRRPEYLYPHSKGYSKTVWVIALVAGFVFAVSWVVVPLYLFLVVLRARHQLAASSGPPPAKAISATPPPRPFKDSQH